LVDLREQLQATLGDRYVLEQELGGGGMSRVFLAHEAELGRKVVVKVLPQEMAGAVSVDRFRREIQLAAQLQHPHIVPLLTAGETNGLPFFTMPYVRGESLRARLAKGGELPISESVRILREVASALAYAHENNVVHRDIKPENVLISGGSAVVTDFGVAKALTASSGANAGSLTSMGVALGTPAYMAPEQATADPATDHRADIYALGVMAYELLTGSTPFQGRSPQATLAAHVTEKPDSIANRRTTVPPALASIVMSCLEKRPSDRPQTAHEVMHQLDALSTPSGGMTPTTHIAATAKPQDRRKILWAAAALAVVAVIVVAGIKFGKPSAAVATKQDAPMILVIPFENVGRAEGAEFTDGITEEITSRLSSLSGLKVIGRQTSRGYAGTTKSPQQIATELGVNYLLTGTVRWDRSGDGKEIVRVSPALVRTADATQVWGQPYQTVLSGIFEVQSNVANEVANALNVALLAPERSALAARPTENVEAYGFYLRGVELIRNSLEVRNLRSAIVALQKAVELDPEFTAAHAWLSIGHTELYWFHGDRTEERVRLARASADRALALDPSSPTAHLALGIYHYHAKFDYDAALKEFAIVERMRPNDFETIFYTAAIQRRQGKWEESLANMNRAIEIEPRIGLNISDMAGTLLLLRRYDETERAAERALTLSPGDRDAVSYKAEVAIARDGDVATATRYLRQRFDGEARREIAAIIAMENLWPAATDPVMRQAMLDVSWFPDAGERSFFLDRKAAVYHLAGDRAKARAYADSGAILLRQRLKDRADDAQYYIALSRVEALRGNNQEALGAIERAVALRPVSRDAFGGPEVLTARAFTLTLTGDYEGAAKQLEELLAMPSYVSRNWIRLHPVFAPLRDNPRFKRLVSQ
jgi:TolB-like protein/Tfp pilus assembly protein PilF